MSDKKLGEPNQHVVQIAPGLALVFDLERWTLENALSISGLGDDVILQIDLRLQDILAETSQRVEGIAILRNV